ncbi:MAG: C25 family cysteine peptidase, partial [Candidatus Latescibacteria bacterium]|nr:C25 family cysteine peptidase [Candidatus Latescibacterota bacterium]
MFSRRRARVSSVVRFFLLVTCIAGVPLHAAGADVSFTVTAPERSRVVASAAGDRVVVDGAGWDALHEPGWPELPYRVVRVLLPQGTTAGDLVVGATEPRRIATRVRPFLAEPFLTGEGGIARPASAYSGERVFPDARARLLGVGYLHGFAIASFAVYPFELRDGELFVFDRVDVRVATRAAEAAPVARERYRAGFLEGVRARLEGVVVNPEAIDGYSLGGVVVPKPRGGFQPTAFPSLEGSPVDYLIITTDALAASFQPLADWKTDKGVPTVIRTIEWIAANARNGSDLPETMRNFIIEAYAKWGITYAMIGGDTEVIPTRFAFSAFYDGGKDLPVDMYLGCLDGDWNADHDAIFGEFGVDAADLYSEVYTGRLPVRNPSEVAVCIGKVMDYETPLFRTYGKKILLLGEVLFPADYDPGDPISLNGADLLDYIRQSWMTDPALQIAPLYETPGSYPGPPPALALSRQASIDSINAGQNHVVHIGHGFRFNMSLGDASLVNSDADALVNGGRLCNLNMLNCTAVAYTYDCLAEHFLRNPNGGACSAVGANDSAFPNASTYYIEEFYRLLFDQNVTNLGELFARSREPRTPLALASDGVDLWTHYVYTLLGDPEMPLWSDSVDILSVNHVASINKGTNNITVTVTESAIPVEGARVCLTKDEDDYEVGITDASGQATLPFRAESAGTIKVVVTGLNYKRYEGDITVGGTGAYCRVSSIAIDDDNVNGTIGNNNDIVEAGERVDFALTIQNTGTASTSGTLSVRFRSSTPGVTVIDSLANVSGSIPAGGTVVATSGPRVDFASSMTDEAVAAFVAHIRVNGVHTWRDDFKKEVGSPALALVNLRIDDTATGNGNGVVEAGEQFRLFYRVKNFGTGAYPGGNGTVTDLDAGFTITDGTDPYPAFASQTEAENTGGFILTETSVATEHRLRLSIVDSYGRAYVDTFELRPPASPINLVVDPSLGADRLRVTFDASPSIDAAFYNVYRSNNVAGPFTKVNVDPVAHTLFVNTGLSATTNYFYHATTVDASGNESAPSPVQSGSTNPAQLAGWPIHMEDETASSPAVGDIDGDGDLEVVVGDHYVYAWHHDGFELVDGDNSALTWGILNTQGQNFVSHVALATVDQVPGLDIVAASRDTKQVFVFNAAGDVLPGWPRPVENTIRAGIAVGDLDGFYGNEIVAIDELGVVYAWNVDGSEYIDGDANPLTQGVLKRLPGTVPFHYPTPALADLDGDDKDEIVVGTMADQLHAFNDDGSNLPGFPLSFGGDVSGSPAIGDIDNNGDLEIVVNIASGSVVALHHTGATMWTRSIPNGLFFAPSPALANIIGDAKLETFIPSSDGKLYGLSDTGADLAGFPVTYSTTAYTESSPIIADVDGDGFRDIVLGGEEKYIWGWDRNGIVLAGFPLSTGDAMRGVPTLTDLDLDGSVDLVAAGWDKGVYVWDFTGTWNEANAPWPRFHANLHNNGRVGYSVPTPVGGVSFAYAWVERGLELQWIVPEAVGGEFTVSRAAMVGSEPG